MYPNSSIATNGKQVEAFLERKWQREHCYKLVKQLWAAGGDRIAVTFQYEYCNTPDAADPDALWFRAYGNENWEFAPSGLMRRRVASINDVPIAASERRLTWQGDRRPDDFPGLSYWEHED